MTDRHATFLIADEALVSLNGKFLLSGVYTTDLIIPLEEAQLPQLVVFVLAETPVEKPFQTFQIHVQLPGESAPRILDATPMLRTAPRKEDRTLWRARVPFLIQMPTLRAGAIEVTVVHEEGRLSAGRQWVQAAQPTQTAVH